MQQYGYAVPDDKQSGFSCPFCQKKSASLRTVNGRQWFKCFNTSCPSATSEAKASWDEVRFIAWKLNLSNADGGQGRYSSAQIQFLKDAGVWREHQPARTVIGSRKRKPTLPVPPPDPNVLPPKPSDPDGEVSFEDASPARDAQQPGDGEVFPEPTESGADAAPESSFDEGAASPLPENVIALPRAGGAKGVPPAPPVPPKGDVTSGGDGKDKSEKPPLERFYEQLRLSEADRAELREKRGLSDAMIDRAGFRTNDRGNRAILEALSGEYKYHDLVNIGLWKRGDKRDRDRNLRPTGQFYGWGVVGKKPKAEDPEDGEDYEDIETDGFVWAQKESGKCNPILIPYFDLEGKLVALRPHKGFPKGQPPRLYVARTVPKTRAIITEGEFKARALEDVCADCSVASLPGITQCKNLNVWSDILEWLRVAQPTEVVVAFDNEEKGDPALPGYKVELEKRFEAQVWARVLAERLKKEDYRVSIATLPDEWRDDKGKADWDGSLARLRRVHPDAPERIADEFEKVLGSALRSWEFRQLKMFDGDVESIIADRAAMYSYEPELPWGGKAERKLVKQLRMLAQKLWNAVDQNGDPLKVSGALMRLSGEYEKTWGWYYTLKIPAQTREKLEAMKMRCAGQQQLAAIELLLKGSPQLIAPFRVIPYYVLKKPNGARERLVRIINNRYEDTGIVSLPSHDFTAPRDWRLWLADRGNLGWKGGERELQALQLDINHRLARREVLQQVFHGCERPGGLWFFDDVALDTGLEVLPDKEGIFWHRRQGFTFLRNQDGVPIGDENQQFRITTGAKMNPGLGLRREANGRFFLEKGADDAEALMGLAGELATALHKSFAEYDGFLLLAAFASYAVAPEIYRARGEFPGIWIAGEKGSGKTVAAKVCMAMWGFAELDQPMSFKSSTTVNAIITLGQLANIPDWGDEYKEGQIKEEAIKNIIHCGFNREIPGKWSPDGTTRKIRTNFIVTGESTCDNAATMDRYLTVNAARENWRGDVAQCDERFKWLLANRKHFFVIIRALLKRRAEFVQTVEQTLAEWEQIPELALAEPRGKFSHGVAYAALLALLKIIPFAPQEMVLNMKEWFIKRTLRSSREVRQQVNVNQFLSDMVSAVRANAFGNTPAELRKYFKVREYDPGTPVVTPHQQSAGLEKEMFRWKSYYFYMVPGSVVEVMKAWKRKSGSPLPLDLRDLSRQLSARAFWVKPADTRTMHSQKFTGNSPSSCWCLLVDKLPDIGFVPVSDEEFEASKYENNDPASGRYLGHDDEWIDPRKGDLFYLIELLLKKRQVSDEDAPGDE